MDPSKQQQQDIKEKDQYDYCSQKIIKNNEQEPTQQFQLSDRESNQIPQAQQKNFTIIRNNNESQQQNNQDSNKNEEIINLFQFQQPDFRFQDPNFNINCRRTLLLSENQIKHKFKVMSYNILSDAIIQIDEDDYYKNNFFINWDDRGVRILKEIQYYDPDVLSLQEFDDDEKIINENLLKLGYQKVYLSRGNGKKDGCGIFLKINRFELIEYLVLNMSQQQVHQYLLDRPNVAVFALLNDKLSQELILVINCHILFNYNRGDIKILQIQMIQSAIKQIQLGVQKNISVIWCGDFNLIPKSPLYTYLSQGFYDFNTLSFKKFSCQQDTHYSKTDLDLNQVFYKLSLNSNRFYQKYIYYEAKNREYLDWYELFHQIKVNRNMKSLATVQKDPQRQVQNDYSLDIKFDSSYAYVQEKCFKVQYSPKEKYMKYTTFEPMITTLGKTTIGTVDYIWYSNTFNTGNLQIQPISVVEAPSTKDLMKFPTFPNYNFPSDHIPLIVEFGFCKNI